MKSPSSFKPNIIIAQQYMHVTDEAAETALGPGFDFWEQGFLSSPPPTLAARQVAETSG